MTVKEMIATIAISFIITIFSYLNTLILRYRIKNLEIENGHLWAACESGSNCKLWAESIEKAEQCRDERKIDLMMGAMS